MNFVKSLDSKDEEAVHHEVGVSGQCYHPTHDQQQGKRRSFVTDSRYSYRSRACTANALHRKFDTNIPRNETVRLVPNFYIYVPVSDFYTPTIGLQTQSAKYRRTDRGESI